MDGLWDSEECSEEQRESPSLPSLSASLQQRFMSPNLGGPISGPANKFGSTYSLQPRMDQVMTLKEVDARMNELRRENFNLKLRLYFAEEDKNGGVQNDEYNECIRRRENLTMAEMMEYEEVDDGGASNNRTMAGNEILSSLLNYGLENESQRRELEEHLAKYMEQKELLYHFSSESDDDWSEPNRDASKARVGLEENQLNSYYKCKASSRSLPRKKSSRRKGSAAMSCMSSLGLLSDFSAMMTKNPRKKVTYLDAISQTDELEEEVKEIVHSSIQTEEKIVKDEGVQVKFESQDKGSQIQLVKEISEKQVQTDLETQEESQGKERTNEICSKCSNYLTNETIEQNNLCTNVVTSFPPTSSSNVKSKDSNKDDGVFKVPNINRTKLKIEQNKTKSSNSIDTHYNSNHNNPLGDASSLNLMKQYSRSLPKVRQSLRKDVANVSKILDGDLSSPDLGIGDSDQDLSSTLRAYLTLYKYQLLRHQVNEAMTLLSKLEACNRDYGISLMTPSDYHSSITGSLMSLINVVRCTKKLCGQFTIEDSNSLFNQLESMRMRKENMEKAISRQLMKTDQLLKKAKVNLKE